MCDTASVGQTRTREVDRHSRRPIVKGNERCTTRTADRDPLTAFRPNLQPPPPPPPATRRPRLARRRSPLLLLAAALVALAVFFVNQAPPASADHGRDTEIWSATLTAQSTQAGPGCSSTSATVANKCSTAATLTDNQFTYLGVDYEVRQIIYSNGVLSMSFNKDISQAFKDLTLYIGGVRTSLADADVVFSVLSPSTASQASVTAISVGDTVQLKLVREYWTGVQFYNGVTHDADGYQHKELVEGAVATFDVRLTQAPTATVTVRIGKLATAFGIDDFDAVSVSPETLTFTTSNWQDDQLVLITAHSDADADDDRIIIAAFVSIAGSAGANDPYRSPDRVNGFVVTVNDTHSSSPATDGELGRLKRPEEAQPEPQVLANNAPTVAAPLADLIEPAVGGGQEIDLSGVFADADGDALTYSALTTNEDISVGYIDGSRLLLLALGRGTVTITVTADDGNGGTVSDVFTVTVKEAPTVASPIADIGSLEAGASRQVSLSGVFADADGDTLTFSAASSDTAVASAGVSNISLTVTAQQAGTATITVTARDADGNQVSDTFSVTVIARPEPQVEASASEPEQEQDVVARYDANGDGVISRSEYLAAVADIGKGVTYADLVLIRQAWVDGGYQQ